MCIHSFTPQNNAIGKGLALSLLTYGEIEAGEGGVTEPGSQASELMHLATG